MAGGGVVDTALFHVIPAGPEGRSGSQRGRGRQGAAAGIALRPFWIPALRCAAAGMTGGGGGGDSFSRIGMVRPLG
jgi:hypothetical protein